MHVTVNFMSIIHLNYTVQSNFEINTANIRLYLQNENCICPYTQYNPACLICFTGTHIPDFITYISSSLHPINFSQVIFYFYPFCH